MGEKVRSFVAIELPDAWKIELGKMIEALDAADIPGIRTVRTEGVGIGS